MLSLLVLLLAFCGAGVSIWVTRDWENPLIGYIAAAVIVGAGWWFFRKTIRSMPDRPGEDDTGPTPSAS